MFTLLGASLMIWYFVLFQRQAIPTFVSQFDKNSYPIFATPNFISAAVLIAASVVTSISYINSATGEITSLFDRASTTDTSKSGVF
ncbi:unique hypothetical protein [Mycoplasmoides gallisepticum str. R(low)]|uniref:Uncharacterized protein n=1 Tax=Mycoplasmoides gallisepticum (strain R(low / passage 15 / clone 2)) TaxID=710127 RepID=Q7NAS5_MYCGA|nr:hypothetical protein [Mycoplasmoides gallisepticum]AAP56910.1 unique hypothetical protein [Mycoplasmoides gallisepticum str. R(low)]ADC30774.1 hypothetical protein MGAH_0324 [Mycoplasmoides gallisepticum str. R(high)]WVH36470.1 hypothetical protein SE856_03330 [Mycoplasmoides gallisepticum]